MSLVQLIYHSRIVAAGEGKISLQNLRDILAVAQAKNAANNLTGFLICDGASFIQVLEGEPAALAATFDRIKRDRRHTAVTVIDQRAITARTFGKWSMAAAMRGVDQQEVFLRHGFSGEIDLSKLTAKKALALALDLRDLSKGQDRTAA